MILIYSKEDLVAINCIHCECRLQMFHQIHFVALQATMSGIFVRLATPVAFTHQAGKVDSLFSLRSNAYMKSNINWIAKMASLIAYNVISTNLPKT